MTRDHRGWIVAALGAYLASLTADPARVERLIEADRRAIISELCQLGAMLALWMKASPLNEISDEGRERYLARAEAKRSER